MRGLLIALIALTFSAGTVRADLDTLEDVTNWLVGYEGLVGMAVGYADSNQILDIRVAGLRKVEGDPVASDDLWHIGSITKSMTSVLIGQQIEEKGFSTATPLSDMLDLPDMHPAWRYQSLRLFLDHMSGLPANFGRDVMRMTPLAETDRIAARHAALAEILTEPPISAEMVYSNIGYTLLGHVVEQQTGMVWEEVMRQRLFTPLGLTSAGFGAPQGDQPWGHRSFLGIGKAPVDPTLAAADNTPVIGPAGTVHMSLPDLLTYGQELLRLAQGEDGIIRHETFAELFIQPDMAYRGGLVSGQDEAFGGQIYWHNGSNTMWYALLVIAPEQDRVIAITTNYFGPHFDEYVWEAAREIAGF